MSSDGNCLDVGTNNASSGLLADTQTWAAGMLESGCSHCLSRWEMSGGSRWEREISVVHEGSWCIDGKAHKERGPEEC